ncbi:hypothetical protein [Bacillus arachidis]|uniref:hypothetical protein n=1 Tax=Bacillus arachidis TaxID=2819290 RepID=UPI00255C58FD|nr:hypothetical protein [Bacillus arachidis]WIY59543.1 hypothetical protein QRY57_16960 [Bacillus arachidis]
MSQWIINDERKKNSIGCFLTFLLSIGIVIASIIYAVYWVFFEEVETLLLKDASPNQLNQLDIRGIAHGHIWGDTEVKIYFTEKGKVVKTEKVRISNYLESNHPNRYKISWKGNTEVSILMRFEYATKTLEYNFETGKISGHDERENNRFF